MKNIILKQQLRKAGATSQEARNLTAITDGLRDSIPHLEPSAKQRIAQEIGIGQRPLYARPRFVSAGAFATVALVCIVAQFAQPGSPLYALKRATEEVRVIVQPSFKAELQQRRQDEQKIEDQQKTDEIRSSGSEDNSSPGSSSDDTGSGLNLNESDSGSGSGTVNELNVDSSGSGSGEIRLPEVKPIDTSGSGSSNDIKSSDRLRVLQSPETH